MRLHYNSDFSGDAFFVYQKDDCITEVIVGAEEFHELAKVLVEKHKHDEEDK